MKGRLFSDEELKEMGVPTADAIVKAIDAGDLDRAKRLVGRMQRESLSMHDLFLHWVTALLSFIGKRYGDEVLYEAFKEGCGAWLKPLVQVYETAPPRRRAQLMAAGLRGHLQPIAVEEDEEKVTFLMQPCGSGGRLVLGNSYGPPSNYLKVKKPQAMTYGRQDLPVYCCHCSFQEILPIEVSGNPLFVTEPSQNLGHEPCRISIYKDPGSVPDKFYKRVGKARG